MAPQNIVGKRRVLGCAGDPSDLSFLNNHDSASKLHRFLGCSVGLRAIHSAFKRPGHGEQPQDLRPS